MRVPLFLFAIFMFFLSSLEAKTSHLEELIGFENLEILQEPKDVTIMEMSGSENVREKRLTSLEVRRIQRNLLDDHNYDFERVISCPFKPEMSLRFENVYEKSVDIFVSLSCQQLLVWVPGGSVLLDYAPVSERLDPFFKELMNSVKTR